MPKRKPAIWQSRCTPGFNGSKTRWQKPLIARVYFFKSVYSPIVSIGTDTFINELIVLAGGENIAAGSTAYPRFNREQVLSFAPEVIIISSMTRGASFEQIKAEWKSWPKIPAVQNHRIDIVDSDLFDRPTPRLVEALELLVKLIHPEIFGNSQ